MATSVSHAMLTERDWFTYKTRKATVCTLVGEGADRTIQDFVANCICNGDDHAEVMDRGFAVHDGALMINTEQGLAVALTRLDEFKEGFGQYPDVLIIDTARKNMRGSVSDDNHVALFYEALAAVQEHAPGISIVVIAHMAKSATGTKGSSDWEQGADYVLHVDGKVNTGKTKVTFEKVKTGKDGHSFSVGYEFLAVPDAGSSPVPVLRSSGATDPQSPVFKPVTTGEPLAEVMVGDLVQAAVEEVLAANPTKEFNSSQLAGDAANLLGSKGHTGISAEAVRYYLKKMRDAGHRAYQRIDGKGHWRHPTSTTADPNHAPEVLARRMAQKGNPFSTTAAPVQPKKAGRRMATPRPLVGRRAQKIGKKIIAPPKMKVYRRKPVTLPKIEPEVAQSMADHGCPFTPVNQGSAPSIEDTAS
jgi:AAA domain